MNRKELSEAAAREGIRPSTFSVEGGLPPDKYVLSLEPGGWSVYYSERGKRIGEARFDTEDEACSELLLRLTRDPTTRKG